MTGEICEYECDPGFSVGPTHRCGLEVRHLCFSVALLLATLSTGLCFPASPEHPARAPCCPDTRHPSSPVRSAQAFEGGFCSPNDCIEGLEIVNSESICAGWLGDNCTYECDVGYTVTATWLPLFLCAPHKIHDLRRGT